MKTLARMLLPLFVATVAMASTPVSYGTIYSVTGTGIHTSYVAGSAFSAGKPGKIRITVKLVTVSGTNIASSTVKVSASDDCSTYYDVMSSSDVATDVGVEHTVNASANTTAAYSINVDGNYKCFMLSGKVTGGAGKSGESFTATATGYI